jgi:phosphoribosylaminoimidazolecarboxamide formyltransferase/IMP cyclohydrolase
MPRALLSVSDKTGIAELGRGLVAHGFTLLSTGGTRRALIEAGLAVTSVSDVTGFPEMMDGRVKTLHPALHGGILARRDRPDDLAALERLGLGLIDVVVVNLYPFSKAASNPETPFDALVEEIDIGGPSLVRAAAKNFRDVLVVVDPADYPRLLSVLDRGPSLDFRYELMAKAFTHTAQYDTTIATTLLSVKVGPNGPERADLADSHFRPTIEFDGSLAISAEKIRDLRYGENPHQRAAWYREKGDVVVGADGAGLGAASILQGRELSYTNLLDLDAAARIALEFRDPAAAVIKHTNPCGAAVGHSIAEAYGRARDADRVAAFGGIVGLNRPIDLAAAQAIVSTFIEAVIAPAVDEAARPVLARKANMRVVTAQFDALKGLTTELRSILGAILVQERDHVIEAQKPWTPTLPDGFRVVTKRQPSPEEWEALRFAWRICAHVKSNTVLFTTADRTLAIGAGQTSRVDAVRVALMKAGSISLTGSVAASDAFFPFRDGLDAVASAGATAVVHPGGSVRDEEVIAAADEHGMAMVLTGRRHFRH